MTVHQAPAALSGPAVAAPGLGHLPWATDPQAGTSVRELLRELADISWQLRLTPAIVVASAAGPMVNPKFVELVQRQHRIVRMLRARRLSAPAVGGRYRDRGPVSVE